MLQKFFHFARFRILCLLMLCGIISVSFAEAALDPSRSVSLVIQYHSGDTALSGAVFSMYKVANISSSVRFTLTEAFKDAPVSLDRLMDQSAWKESADVLKRHVQNHAVAPTATAETDAEGKSIATMLPSGLYLVTGEKLELDWNVYTPETALILLPNRSTTGEWLYEVEMHPKPEIEVIERISRQVVKVWNDQANVSNRPTQLTVEMYRDGEIYDTVTLSAANGWSHRWTDLDGRCQWTVREPDIPAGYSSKITQSGERFIITNTLSSAATPAPDSSLPQTGLTWWPVPVLVLAGMSLFLIGWLRQRRHH